MISGFAECSQLGSRRSCISPLTILICVLRLTASAATCASSDRNADDCQVEIDEPDEVILLALRRKGNQPNVTPGDLPDDSTSEPNVEIAETDTKLLETAGECKDQSPWCWWFEQGGYCDEKFLFQSKPVMRYWCPETCDACELEDRDEMGALLERHNAFRADHGVPALIWDDALASQSEEWAGKCEWKHSENGNGENLWAGTGSFNGETATESWYDEIRNYNFNDHTIHKGVVGHFTQVVWKATTKIGCAVQMCENLASSTPMSNANFLVCQYLPRGNVVGDYKANVLAWSNKR